MIVNSTGITKSDLAEYLTFWVNNLRTVLGDNYTIKKEGIVDNLATASSLTSLAVEDVIMYLAKQMNPYTAEGEFQDALYALIGLIRYFSSYTVVTRTIKGGANQTYDVGSIRFKNTATEDIFSLNTAVTTDGNGLAVGSFTALEIGAIELDSSATLELVDAPDDVESVYYTSGNITTVGDDYEDDSEFRMRWINTNSVMATSRTEGGLRTALLPLVAKAGDLKIRQNRGTQVYNDASLSALHTINIVLKSAESDNTIAQRILDYFPDGVGISGTTTVTLKDSENVDVDIKFTKATERAIYFNVEVVLKSGYTLTSDLTQSIKNAIIDNFNYDMGEKVIANDFYQYINVIDGIDYVTTLAVSNTSSGYTSLYALNYNEYATVTAEHITVGT